MPHSQVLGTIEIVSEIINRYTGIVKNHDHKWRRSKALELLQRPAERWDEPVKELDGYWPKSVAHLGAAYDDGVSDHVVIAQISEELLNGYKGFRKICTALVPLHQVDEVLEVKGGIGWEVKSWGPLPCVDEGRVYDTHFWVDGRKGRGERFQAIINTWSHHNQEVMLPDNVMLMAYGLVPRYLSEGIVCWDDPRAPVYDVLRVQSHVDYSKKTAQPLTQIIMRRDYLEDYCSLKGCAAVAVYYEERYSSDDKTYDEVLNGQEGAQFELPGRLLGMAVLDDKYHEEAPQFSRVWGCRLILKPTGRPITDAKDPSVVWPGETEPMTRQRASKAWVHGYVRDEVLREYESRPEFDVHPETGGVSYDGWWAVGHSQRIGRDHIRIEMKKLYEGCPPHVIAHWHRFAVAKEVAEQDRGQHGDRNIAVRAKEVVHGYLRLTESLEAFSDAIGGGFVQKEIGSLSTSELDYSGWWLPPVVKPLTAIAPLLASRNEFLARAVSLFQLLEGLKPAPLRNMVLQLGVEKKSVEDYGALKLLSCLCQLRSLAADHGHSLPEDAVAVVALWNAQIKITHLERIFALNVLRINTSHAPSARCDKKISEAAAKFGIDVAAQSSGWGYAIDVLYDGLSEDLNALAELLA
jgi:hypothetical protein